MPPSAAFCGTEQLTAFELERAEKIRQNEAKLSELGLKRLANDVSAATAMVRGPLKAKPAKAPRSCKAPTTGPSRRSLRVAGAEPELPPELLHLAASISHRVKVRSNPSFCDRPSSLLTEACDHQEWEPDEAAEEGWRAKRATLDNHNWLRFRTMSRAALRTRIHRITNVAKLRSFVTLLRGQEEHALAEEGEAALEDLVGGSKQL